MDVFAAGTRTLVDREIYLILKAGHDHHLHHSEPIFENGPSEFPRVCYNFFLVLRNILFICLGYFSVLLSTPNFLALVSLLLLCLSLSLLSCSKNNLR